MWVLNVGGTQHCLIVMLEKFKKLNDKGEKFGSFFTDLPKAFDCIDHNLLISKLSWYGVTPKSLKLIFSYSSNRTQGVTISNSYRRKSEFKYGVPQGSVLGPLPFNINLSDLFFEYEDDNNSRYADDINPYSCVQDMPFVISELQRIAKKNFNWSRNNHMKANPEKCQRKGKLYKGKFSNVQKEILSSHASIGSSLNEKLLGINLDSELKFEKHINKIWNIVNKKLNALHRIGSHISFGKRKMLLRVFFESQFSYCPVIWMFNSRTLNNKINRLHEKSLIIVYGD